MWFYFEQSKMRKYNPERVELHIYKDFGLLIFVSVCERENARVNHPVAP